MNFHTRHRSRGGAWSIFFTVWRPGRQVRHWCASSVRILPARLRDSFAQQKRPRSRQLVG